MATKSKKTLRDLLLGRLTKRLRLLGKEFSLLELTNAERKVLLRELRLAIATKDRQRH
jgi:hypothetical protein